jgi:hypothetical protein
LGDISASLKRARTSLDSFLDGSEIFPFSVSLESARRLRDKIETLMTDGTDDSERLVTASEASRLSKLTKEFETVASAEVSSFNTYQIMRKLAYDTRTLIEEGEALLPKKVQDEIPAEAVVDLKEAAKCMAFEVNTACAFHTIRATEAVLRVYYRTVVGTTPKVKDRNWGTYIRLLKAKGADPRITGFLDHIREAYRNPITHPEQVVDASEAQVLLGVCVSAIIQMVRAIRSSSALSEETRSLMENLYEHSASGSPT